MQATGEIILQEINLSSFEGKLEVLKLHSLLRSRLLDVTQRSPFFGGSVAWHPKDGCEGD